MTAVVPPSSLEGRLAALANDGAHLRDPVAFFYLQTLARRASTQSNGVRQRLETALAGALADYERRWAAAPSAITANPSAPTPPSALVVLNQHIRGQSRNAPEPGAAGDAAPGKQASAPAMKSVVRFRQAWTMIRTQDQVRQAIAQGPENAGPLNSHMLLLRSLRLMRQLSPDYLQHFMAQASGLLWLDEVSLKPTAPAPPAPARRAARQAALKAKPTAERAPTIGSSI